MDMLFEFIRWWYGLGWLKAWRNASGWVIKVEQAFAVKDLLGSLFAPWKRIISFPGRSIDEKIMARLDNLVSRAIGFFVRLGALIAAAFLIVITGVISLAMAIAWPLVPFAMVYCLVRGILG
jgi:hypothetical protein